MPRKNEWRRRRRRRRRRRKGKINKNRAISRDPHEHASFITNHQPVEKDIRRCVCIFMYSNICIISFRSVLKTRRREDNDHWISAWTASVQIHLHEFHLLGVQRSHPAFELIEREISHRAWLGLNWESINGRDVDNSIPWRWWATCPRITDNCRSTTRRS